MAHTHSTEHATTGARRRVRVDAGSPGERRTIDELYERAWQLKLNKPEDARALCREVHERSDAIGYALGRAHGLLVNAALDRAESAYGAARAAAEGALAVCRAHDDNRGSARSLSLLGMIDRWQGEPERGAQLQHESIALCRRCGYRQEEAGALVALSQALRVLGHNHEALEAAVEAYSIAEAAGCAEEEAFALLAMGAVMERLSRYDEALATYGKCRAIAVKLDSRRLIAYVAGNLSPIAYRAGDVAAALDYELECLISKEALKDRAGIGISLNNIGLYYSDLGDYARSLEALVESLEIAQTIGDREGESVALNNIGLVYEALDEHARVLDCYLRSMKISQEIGNVSGEAFSHSHLGRLYENSGDYAKALVYYLKSLRQFEICGAQREHAASLRYIGRVYATLGERGEADRHFLEGLHRARELGDAGGEIETLVEIAKLDRGRLGEAAAIARLEEALSRADGVSLTTSRRLVLQLLVEVCTVAGDESRRQLYERLAMDQTQASFNASASRRVRAMIARFDGNVVLREGRMLGLSEEDLARVDAVLRGREVDVRVPGPLDARNAGDPDTAPPDRQTEGPVVQPWIRVSTFGVLDVAVNGRALGRADWSRKRARDLFKLLVVHHGQWLTVDTIFEKLWVTSEDRKAALLVRNAATHIRRALAVEHGTRAPANPVHCVDGAYMLDLGAGAWIDFMKFKELMVAARTGSSAEDRRRSYAAAVELYRGDFLAEDAFQEWTAFERRVLKDAFLEALEFLAREYMRIGRADEAIEYARRIICHDETSESAYEVLLTALRSRGRLSEMRFTFQECARAFRRELAQEPPVRLREIVGEGGIDD